MDFGEKPRKSAYRKTVVICLFPLASLAVANIYYVGRAAGGLYEFGCSKCAVTLRYCPGKNLRSLDVPETYAIHDHTWVRTHCSMPTWSKWKPWQWLAWISTTAKEPFKIPDPNAIFQSAHVNLKYSDEIGIAKLAADPNYENSRYIQEYAKDAGSPASQPWKETPHRSPP